MGALKNEDLKTHFGPHGDPGPQMGTYVATVLDPPANGQAVVLLTWFLSDPGKPGVRSLGPDVRPSVCPSGSDGYPLPYPTRI